MTTKSTTAKINILFIAPPRGIGGANRKFLIYFKYLSSRLFNKYYVGGCIIHYLHKSKKLWIA